MADVVKSFDEAVEKYREFLAENGYPNDIVWVWPEDVLATGTKRVFVKIPIPPESAKRAKEMYEVVMQADCGLRMATLGGSNGRTYCYLWGWPQDHEREPQLLPCRGLAMSALSGEGRRSAVAIRSRLRWSWLSWRFRAEQARKKLMFS